MILGKYLGIKCYRRGSGLLTILNRKGCVGLIQNETQNKNNYSTLLKREQIICHINNYQQIRNESQYVPSTGMFKLLSESAPVEISQNCITSMHEYSGLPWWASIIFTTVALRTCITLPLAIYQNIIMAKFENLFQEMPNIVNELKKETAIAIKKYKWTQEHARAVYNRSLKKQFSNLVIRDNCHPLKTTVLLWVQLPMWIFLSMGIRNLIYMLPNLDVNAQITYVELTMGGLAWIPNLTEVDHSLILPITLGLTNLAITELQVLTRTKRGTRFQKYITIFFRFLSIGMIPIAAYVPACLSLYWTTSSVYGLLQNLILLSPRVKRILKIPRTITERDRPYKHIAVQIAQKLHFPSVKTIDPK